MCCSCSILGLLFGLQPDLTRAGTWLLTWPFRRGGNTLFYRAVATMNPGRDRTQQCPVSLLAVLGPFSGILLSGVAQLFSSQYYFKIIITIITILLLSTLSLLFLIILLYYFIIFSSVFILAPHIRSDGPVPLRINNLYLDLDLVCGVLITSSRFHHWSQQTHLDSERTPYGDRNSSSSNMWDNSHSSWSRDGTASRCIPSRIWT